MLNCQNEFFTIPRLEQIAYLVHGFGTAERKETDFRKSLEGKDFRILHLKQVHSNIVHFVDKIPDENLRGDAVVTALPHLLLVIKTADCLPVLMAEESKRIIAAVHCGWRGTQKKVIQRTIKGMESHYGCQPSSLLVAFGPCIGPDCYEVGEDVRRSYEKAGLASEIFRNHPSREGKYFLDLRKATRLQLLSLGVKKENLYGIDSCSHCCDFLPSYRRDGKSKTRMESFIGMSF